MKLVTIEFTQDTFTVDEVGDEVPVRSKGDRVRVDPVSAKSFVEIKRVAKIVGKPAQRAEPKATVKAAPTAPEPSEPDTEGDTTA